MAFEFENRESEKPKVEYSEYVEAMIVEDEKFGAYLNPTRTLSRVIDDLTIIARRLDKAIDYLESFGYKKHAQELLSIRKIVDDAIMAAIALML